MLKFNANGKFRIMQITDIQEVPNISPDTLKLIEAAVQTQNPDLIVLTGDQIKGYGISYKGKGSELESHVADTIKRFMKPITDRGIPFAVTFGNHDRQVGVSNKRQFEHIYKKLPGCVGEQAPEIEGGGTYHLPLYSANGKKMLFNLYLIDSGTDKKGGGYEAVTAEQIKWYRSTRERLRAENSGAYVPSIVFQHIPLCEYYDVLKRVKKNHKGAIRAYRTHKNEYYVPGESCRPGAVLLEPPSIPDENTGEFDALKEKGDVLAVFVGHDHKNNFVGTLQGVDLGFTPSGGFSEYGNGVNRGVRIIDLDESCPHAYKTHTVTFKELCGTQLHKPFKDFIYRHAPATTDAAIPLIVKAVIGLGALITGIVLLIKFL